MTQKPLTIEEIANKLRPVFGKRIDEIYFQYTVADSKEEREAQRAAGEPEIKSKEGNDSMLDHITHLLHDQGVRDEDIQKVSVIIKEKLPISSKIMELASKYKVDTILLCKHNKKKPTR